jgi:hypothetical protein
VVLQKNQFQIILTQFNYSSLQMKEYTPVASSYGSEGNRDVGSEKEGLAFATASFNDFSSKVTERQKQV